MQEIEEWGQYEDFVKSKQIVENIMVVNDAAERAVQLGSRIRQTVRYGSV